MSTTLRLLILGDRQAEAKLLLRELRQADFEPTWQRVENETDYVAALQQAAQPSQQLDIILADHASRPLDVFQALRLLQERKLHVPFIIIGERIGEAAAVSCLKQGATDYVLWGNVSQIGPAVTYALQQKALRGEGRQNGANLSHRLIQVQETERRRIARELHDEIGQALTLTKIDLQTMQRLPEASGLAPHLTASIQTVERALQQVRNLSLDLRPSLLDDLGLIPALRWYVDRQAQRAGISTHLNHDLPSARLPPDIETACFRIAQAALTNVIRHAQAQHVYVELRQSEQALQLSIRDDGVGFDVRAALDRAARGASMGLVGMHERAQLAGGRVEIWSELGHGAEVLARFPSIQPRQTPPQEHKALP